jgi:hypothetical protein
MPDRSCQRGAFRISNSTVSTNSTMTPNHALQRTATAVTARASAAAFPPTMHGPRQPPPSLSLGSLGAYTFLCHLG